MFLNQCKNGTVLSTYYTKAEFEKIVSDFLDPMFEKIHKDISYRIEYLNSDVHIDFPVFVDNMEYWTPAEDAELKALEDAGFSEHGHENFEKILEQMCPGEEITTLVDQNNETVTMEFYGKGNEIITMLDDLYNELPNLDRDDTALVIAKMHKLLKKEWNWSR